MAQAVCSNHGTVEAEWKEGTSKAGKNYAFWGCPVKGKDPKTGNWWKCKVEVANTPSGKFDQSIDKAAAQDDNHKKSEVINRLAIIKSMIEAGWKYSPEAIKEMANWLAIAEGRNPIAQGIESSVTRPMTNADILPTEAPSEEIPLSEIPF